MILVHSRHQSGQIDLYFWDEIKKKKTNVYNHDSPNDTLNSN